MLKRLIHTLLSTRLACWTPVVTCCAWMLFVCAAHSGADCCAQEKVAHKDHACCAGHALMHADVCEDAASTCECSSITNPAEVQSPAVTLIERKDALSNLPAQPQAARTPVETASRGFQAVSPGLSANAPYILAGKLLSHHVRLNT